MEDGLSQLGPLPGVAATGERDAPGSPSGLRGYCESRVFSRALSRGSALGPGFHFAVVSEALCVTSAVTDVISTGQNSDHLCDVLCFAHKGGSLGLLIGEI